MQHDVFTHKLRRTESYVGRPHSPATAATWGRYLFNPATSHTLYAAAPPIHTLCVTTNEDRKNFAQCFVSFAKGSSSQAVPPSCLCSTSDSPESVHFISHFQPRGGDELAMMTSSHATPTNHFLFLCLALLLDCGAMVPTY